MHPNNGLSRLPTNHLSKCSANHPRYALPTSIGIRKLSGRKIAARSPMKLWFDFFSHIISCSTYQNVSFREGNQVFFHCSGRVGCYHVISCAQETAVLGPPLAQSTGRLARRPNKAFLSPESKKIRKNSPPNFFSQHY